MSDNTRKEILSSVKNDKNELSVNANRQSNIELLRIIAIVGVIILHYSNPNVGGGLRFAVPGSFNYLILCFLNAISICAVDLFYMISGYFMASSYKREIRKPLELIIQLIVFNILTLSVTSPLWGTPLTLRAFLKCFIPNNYFVIFYCVIYILSPYVNKLLDSLSFKTALRLMIILFSCFSFYATFVKMLCNIKGEQIIGLDSVGMYGSQMGYNIVNFMMMYTTGAFLRKFQIKERFKSKRMLAAAFLLSTFMIMIWYFIEEKLPDIFSDLQKIEISDRACFMYSNPFVICEAISILLLFLNMDIGYKKGINTISAAVYSVYLLHGSMIILVGAWRFVQRNPLIMCAHIILSAVGIILICTLVHYLYKMMTRPIFKRLFSRKIVIVDLKQK